MDANGGETSQTFTVNVAPVNDPPTISGIAAQNINEDQPGGTGALGLGLAISSQKRAIVQRTEER